MKKIIDLFAAEIENGKIQVGKELDSLTVRHLLRMSTGQEKEPGGSDCWDDMVSAFCVSRFMRCQERYSAIIQLLPICCQNR